MQQSIGSARLEPWLALEDGMFFGIGIVSDHKEPGELRSKKEAVTPQRRCPYENNGEDESPSNISLCEIRHSLYKSIE
jgi:hypothetical protein